MAFSLIISSNNRLNPFSWLLISNETKCSFLYVHLSFFFLKTKVCLCFISIASLWTSLATAVSKKTEKLASVYSSGCCLTSLPFRSMTYPKCPITAAGNVFYNKSRKMKFNQLGDIEQKQISIKVQSHFCHHSISFWVIRHTHMLSATVTHPNLFYIFSNSGSKRKLIHMSRPKLLKINKSTVP